MKDPEQFRALYAYSPYQHVKDGTRYPAILFLWRKRSSSESNAIAEDDSAFEAATGSDAPILLQTTSKAGHGIGTALRVH